MDFSASFSSSNLMSSILDYGKREAQRSALRNKSPARGRRSSVEPTASWLPGEPRQHLAVGQPSALHTGLSKMGLPPRLGLGTSGSPTPHLNLGTRTGQCLSFFLSLWGAFPSKQDYTPHQRAHEGKRGGQNLDLFNSVRFMFGESGCHQARV